MTVAPWAGGVTVGAVDIVPVTDGVGLLGELAELYPQTPEEAWDPDRALYPELFAGTAWRLFCTCYVIRSGNRTVLVDTGVGPPGLWDWTPEWEGGLLPGLARKGVEPNRVDVVVITHVHVDHVGWNTDADGELVFPRARYVLHRDAVAAARERTERPHIRRCVLPLLEQGPVDELDDDLEVAPGVVVVPLPGHDLGHIGVRIGDEAVVIGDAAAHPALLDEPDRLFASDWDHVLSAATRHALVEELVDTEVLTICGHYPGSGVGRISRDDGRVVWEEAA